MCTEVVILHSISIMSQHNENCKLLEIIVERAFYLM